MARHCLGRCRWQGQCAGRAISLIPWALQVCQHPHSPLVQPVQPFLILVGTGSGGSWGESSMQPPALTPALTGASGPGTQWSRCTGWWLMWGSTGNSCPGAAGWMCSPTMGKCCGQSSRSASRSSWSTTSPRSSRPPGGSGLAGQDWGAAGPAGVAGVRLHRGSRRPQHLREVGAWGGTRFWEHPGLWTRVTQPQHPLGAAGRQPGLPPLPLQAPGAVVAVWARVARTDGRLLAGPLGECRHLHGARRGRRGCSHHRLPFRLLPGDAGLSPPAAPPGPSARPEAERRDPRLAGPGPPRGRWTLTRARRSCVTLTSGRLRKRRASTGPGARPTAAGGAALAGAGAGAPWRPGGAAWFSRRPPRRSHDRGGRKMAEPPGAAAEDSWGKVGPFVGLRAGLRAGDRAGRLGAPEGASGAGALGRGAGGGGAEAAGGVSAG